VRKSELNVHKKQKLKSQLCTNYSISITVLTLKSTSSANYYYCMKKSRVKGVRCTKTKLIQQTHYSIGLTIHGMIFYKDPYHRGVGRGGDDGGVKTPLS